MPISSVEKTKGIMKEEAFKKLLTILQIIHNRLAC
jgi:hypothetical protein